MKYFVIYTVLIGALVACGNPTESRNEATTIISEQQPVNKKISTAELKQFRAEKNDLQLVDVRTPEEISANGKIEGALEINYVEENFKSNLQKLDKDKPVAVYCAAGGRSAKAAAILGELGFKEVYDYSEGYSGWERAQ